MLVAVLFAITVCWYALTPVFYNSMDTVETLASELGMTGLAKSTWDIVYNFGRYTWIWGIIILIGGFILWAVLASVKRQYEWGE